MSDRIVKRIIAAAIVIVISANLKQWANKK